MEVGVQLFGIMLRLLDLVLSPLYWLKSRIRKTVPPIRNPLLLCSAKQLAEAIRKGEHSSEEVTAAFIDRAKEVNPYINAIVEERYRAALEEAKSVDRQLVEARGNGTVDELTKSKPLLGVPFSVKESCSLGGLSNSVGVVEYAGSKALRDGKAVSLIRHAGAIPLLVTNTPELCLGWETTNLIRGTTNNPYHLGRTAAGSSGGEAALLSCGGSAFSVASDIAGSIRIPSAFCGVIGHKPTPGIISIDSHIPSLNDPKFPKLLTIGPIVRKAEDLTLLMSIFTENNKDLRLDTPVDMKNVKVYYMTEVTKSIALIPVKQCIVDAINNAVQYLADECGCTVQEEKFNELEDSVEISTTEFFSMKDIPNMLLDPANPKKERSLLIELLRYTLGGARRTLQTLGFELIHKTKLFIPDSRAPYYVARAKELRDKMQRVLGDDGVFIYPVFNELAYCHNQVFTKASGVVFTMVFNILGFPATVVPVATHDNLPVAVQVVAAPHQDRLCLEVAARLEAGFGGWRHPR